MALINCSECGQQISDQAKRCPSCGHPVKRVKHFGEIEKIKNDVSELCLKNSTKIKAVFAVCLVLIIVVSGVIKYINRPYVNIDDISSQRNYKIGSTYSICARHNPKSVNIMWKSSNPDIVKFEGNKMIVLSRGTCTITAYVKGKNCGSVEIEGTHLMGERQDVSVVMYKDGEINEPSLFDDDYNEWAVEMTLHSYTDLSFNKDGSIHINGSVNVEDIDGSCEYVGESEVIKGLKEISEYKIVSNENEYKMWAVDDTIYVVIGKFLYCFTNKKR